MVRGDHLYPTLGASNPSWVNRRIRWGACPPHLKACDFRKKRSHRESMESQVITKGIVSLVSSKLNAAEYIVNQTRN